MSSVGSRFQVLNRFTGTASLGRPNLRFSGGEGSEKPVDADVNRGDKVELQGHSRSDTENDVIGRYKAILARPAADESDPDALDDSDVQALLEIATPEQRGLMMQLWLEKLKSLN